MGREIGDYAAGNCLRHAEVRGEYEERGVVVEIRIAV